MKPLLPLIFLLCLNQAWALPLAIETALPISLGLGARQTVEVSVLGEGTVELAVDASALRRFDAEGDVAVEVTPRRLTLPGKATLTVATRTSAPSFEGGSFALKARSTSEMASAEVAISVKPRYRVRVLQKGAGACEGNKRVTDSRWICDFDSPTEIAYFRPHAQGLTIEFLNETQDRFFIHGSGAIGHMPFAAPLEPGRVYEAPVIAAEPADLKGSYTLHDIYRPGREVVFNASRVP
jgi:hypothetical protein